MSNLDDYRAEIDAIDKELIKLFEKRMNVVLNVARYKKENNMEIFQNGREEEVINKAVNNIVNKDYEKEVKEFITSTMEISRGLQKRKIEGVKNLDEVEVKVCDLKVKGKLGFPGVKGAYSEEALLKFFGNDNEIISYKNFEDVFVALDNNEIEYGIVPIENSSTGAITDVYDYLRKYDFYIVGEESIKVNQNLIGIKGTKLEDVKEVYSHPQGISQSSNYLKQFNDWKLIPFVNTATSAKLVKDLGDKSKVAIASARAADIYGLDVIEEGINNIADNSTRFVIISKEMKVVPGADKVSVVLSLEHKAGTLYKLLRYFADNNINMMKIESRPMKETSWRYFIYVDFQGDINGEETKKALEQIEKESAYFKILGAYKNIIK